MKYIVLSLFLVTSLYSMDVEDVKHKPSITKEIKIELIKNFTKEEILSLGYNPDVIVEFSIRIIVLPTGERILYTTTKSVDWTDPEKMLSWTKTYKVETTATKL